MQRSSTLAVLRFYFYCGKYTPSLRRITRTGGGRRRRRRRRSGKITKRKNKKRIYKNGTRKGRRKRDRGFDEEAVE
jgi:hypothetical protein